jgi:hypothetical protein
LVKFKSAAPKFSESDRKIFAFASEANGASEKLVMPNMGFS